MNILRNPVVIFNKLTAEIEVNLVDDMTDSRTNNVFDGTSRPVVFYGQRTRDLDMCLSDLPGDSAAQRANALFEEVTRNVSRTQVIIKNLIN